MTTEPPPPRIVTPEEAQRVYDAQYRGGVVIHDQTRRLAHTVITEPDRIRAAVEQETERLREQLHAIRKAAIQELSDLPPRTRTALGLNYRGSDL